MIGVTARPGTLTLGGASFGLGNALGAAPSRGAVEGANTFDTQFGDFSDDWTRESNDLKNSNSRLYNRIEHGAKFIGDVAPDTAIKTQVAARFARAVGEHGPQAEKILGPGLRRLTYRYRGTEKTPDAEAIRQYGIVTGGAAARGELDPTQRKELERTLQAGIKRYRKQKADATSTPEEAVQLGADEIQQVRRMHERRWREERNLLPRDNGIPEEAREAGRKYLAQYLMKNEKTPRKELYNLQLESGNTPASTGFIIDASGKVVTQAQGYGDDHYVPFNLKNLRGLKGGEYIRSRSVGGPTAEDIYTGLSTGARRVTVVSRSGYFTVEFNPETTGGFFNDKAKRMVRRYENIIDAVQSEQVARPVSISPEIQQEFIRRAEQDYPGATPRQRRQYTHALINEYKKELAQAPGEMDDFEIYLAEQTEGLEEGRRNQVRSQMLNDRKRHNEFWFKLNGQGYMDALRSLEEQFPYYIKTDSGPLKELEQFADERDKGYVEPGRNRPTEARAGLFGTVERLGAGKGNVSSTGGKFSASQADYQGYFAPKRERPPGGQREPATQAAGTSERVTTGPKTLDQLHEERSIEAKEISQRKERESIQDKGLVLTQALAEGDWSDAGGLENASKFFPPLGMSNPDDIRNWFLDPKNIRKADEAMKSLDVKGALTERQRTALRDYREATGQMNRVSFKKELMFQQTEQPFRFDDELPYQTGADPSLAEQEAGRLDKQTKPVSVGDMALSTMNRDELRNELNVLIRIHRGLEEINRKYPESDLPGRTKELDDLGVNTSIPGVLQILERNSLDQHAENVHRMLALNLNRGEMAYGGRPSRTLELTAPVETTQHVDPPSPQNKQRVTNHAKVLTDAVMKLTDQLDMTMDTPELRVAQSIGAHAKAYKDASKGQEVSDAKLAELQDNARDALMLAQAINEGRDYSDAMRKYIDDNRL